MRVRPPVPTSACPHDIEHPATPSPKDPNRPPQNQNLPQSGITIWPKYAAVQQKSNRPAPIRRSPKAGCRRFKSCRGHCRNYSQPLSTSRHQAATAPARGVTARESGTHQSQSRVRRGVIAAGQERGMGHGPKDGCGSGAAQRPRGAPGATAESGRGLAGRPSPTRLAAVHGEPIACRQTVRTDQAEPDTGAWRGGVLWRTPARPSPWSTRMSQRTSTLIKPESRLRPRQCGRVLRQ